MDLCSQNVSLSQWSKCITVPWCLITTMKWGRWGRSKDSSSLPTKTYRADVAHLWNEDISPAVEALLFLRNCFSSCSFLNRDSFEWDPRTKGRKRKEATQRKHHQTLRIPVWKLNFLALYHHLVLLTQIGLAFLQERKKIEKTEQWN